MVISENYAKPKIFYFILSYILLIIFLLFTSYKFFISGFILLENIQNESNIKTFLATIDSELKNLNNTTKDYSTWDDTYEFINDRNKEYIYDNFRDEVLTLKNLDISGILYYNLKDEVVFSVYDNTYLESNKSSFEKFIANKFKEKDSLNTIINFNSNFLYLSKNQILKSDKTGDKRGYLVFIKELSSDLIKDNTTFRNIEIKDEKVLNSGLKINFQTLQNVKITTQTNDKYISNKINFFDSNDEYIISIDTVNQRDLVNNGEKTIYIFNSIVSVVLFFIFYFIYRNQYLINTQNYTLNKEVARRTKQLDKAFRKLKDKNHELFALANIDSLTKIRNRRSYFIDSKEALDNAIKNDQNLSILIMDLDHFKSINDTYGHAVGDKVLIEFCMIINSIIDNEAIFGRIGGEEFCITFVNKTIQKVNEIAEEIRIKCANKEVIFNENQILHFTVSMGLSSRDNLTDIDKIIQKSDELLYEAKKGGRNRIIRRLR